MNNVEKENKEIWQRIDNTRKRSRSPESAKDDRGKKRKLDEKDAIVIKEDQVFHESGVKLLHSIPLRCKNKIRLQDINEDQEALKIILEGDTQVLKVDKSKKLSFLNIGEWNACAEIIRKILIQDCKTIEDQMKFNSEYQDYVIQINLKLQTYPLKLIMNYDEMYRTLQFSTKMTWGTLIPDLQTKLMDA